MTTRNLRDVDLAEDGKSLLDITNEEVLQLVEEERSLVPTIRMQ